MKKSILLVIALFTIQLLQAQDQNNAVDQPIFETKDIDVQPDFPGGIENFYNFFYKNFKKPEVPDLIGKIFLAFVVETDGTLIDIRTLKDAGFGTGAEAEKVLQQSPKWIPGRKGGQRVRVNYILPIAIHTD
jgi:protein TonB